MAEPVQDVEGIARRLTKAQLWAIRHGDGVHIAGSTTPACRCKLQDKGIVVRRMYATAYTPLGLALRAHLLSQDSSNDK